MIGSVAFTLAACAGDEPGGRATALPECAPARTTIARPASVPAGFPLPRGTVFTAERNVPPRSVVVSGVIPGGLDGAAHFFRSRLARAGYEEGEGDAEPGIEAESLFHGRRVDGAWKLNAIRGCEGAVRLTLAFVRKR